MNTGPGQKFLGKAFAISLYAVIFLSASATAAPFRPAADDVVLEHLPQAVNLEGRALAKLRGDLRADPKNLTLALGVARRYLDLARAEADPRFTSYAENALQPWWHLTDPPLQVLLLRAIIHQRRHDFDGALADLAQVLARQPKNAQAWLTQAFVQQTIGDFAGAAKSCAGLPAAVGALPRGVCRARVISLQGDGSKAYRLLAGALESSGAADPRLQLWARTVLAEIAERNEDPEQAERHYQAALALDLRDAYLLGAYADFLLDRDRPAAALALLEGEEKVDALLLRQALAADRLGDPQAKTWIATLADRFAASRRRGDARHRREEARFTLDLLQRPADALSLALDNWQVQKEPWDSRLVLEAALAAGSPKAAQPVLRWITARGLQDPALIRLRRALTGEGA